MRVLKEYEPLYFDDYLTADCHGGRAGARSYSITQHALHEVIHSPTPVRAFFLREVHATIYSSLWADFKDRISEYEEQHGVDLSEILKWTDNKSGENTCINTVTGWSITTKGFKVSSGNQTANLKSLAAATHVYIDEADEVSKPDFTKLKLSLRKQGVNLKIIRAFNPPPKDHWIWGDYSLTAVKDDEIVQMILRASDVDEKTIRSLVSKNNKPYYRAEVKAHRHISITTNFVNNFKNLNPDAVAEYDKILLDDIHYYITNMMGLIPNDGGDAVYYEYDKEKHHTDRIVKDGDILHIGMDFNITNMSAVVHVVDSGIAYAAYEFTSIFDTEQMCRIISETFPNHKVIVYPDASGAARKTSSGLSDFDLLRNAGFQIQSEKINPPVRDRINTVNANFRTSKYFVNRFTCSAYSEALSKIKYKGGEPDKKSGYDHVTDAGGYFIANQLGAVRQVAVRSSRSTIRR